MNELEKLVRDALVAHELQDADSARLLDQVRARSARRLQRGWSAAVLAAAATAVVITVVTVEAQRGPGAAPANVATTAPAQTPTPSPTTTQPADTQLVSFHGVEVTVPAAWIINDTRCGTPMSDTVQVWDGGPIPACLTKQPPGLTVVQLWPYDAAADLVDDPLTFTSMLAAVATQATTVDGQPALRGVGVPYGPGGTEMAVLVLPEPGVLISVESPDPRRAQDLLDAVHLAPVDHNGCREQVDMLQTPVSERPGVAAALVPDTPILASICRYSGDWLGNSAAVEPTDLDDLTAILNSLPVGTSTPGPEFFASEGVCAEEQHRGLIVQLSYVDGPPVDVYVRISGCPVLSASNGARTTKVNQALMDFLMDRVGYDGGFPDPRTLQ